MKNLLEADSNLRFHSGIEFPEICGICDLQSLKKKHALFISNKKYLMTLLKKAESLKYKIEVLIVSPIISTELTEYKELINIFNSIYISDNISMSLIVLSKYFYDLKFSSINNYVDGRQMGTTEIDPTALIAQQVFIGEHVKIGKNVKIHSGSRIYPHVEIGEDCEIFSNVTIFSGSKLSKNIRIHSGTSIGTDGFGYNFIDGKHQKIWHIGGVELKDDVEIGANTCIDSGTFAPTIIGLGSKIDNLVQISHNCLIGKHVIICGQVGIAGSCHVGDYTVFAGRSGMSNGATLGKNCVIAAAAIASGSWPDNSKLGGNPARPFNDWLRSKAFINNLIKKAKNKN